MREIKFRAWDKDIKKMFQPNDICRLHFSDGLCYGFLTWEEHMGLKDFELMQYIGLHDKNGKEVYEGDIRGYQGDPSRYAIIYADGAWRKKYPEWDTKYPYPILNQWEINRSIHLGTIYENPELVQP